MDDKYSKAMKVISQELEKDKSPESLYYVWQSNIACCIMDNSDVGHKKANQLAVKVIKLLMK